MRQMLRVLATAALLLAGAFLVAARPALGPQQQRSLRAWYRALLRVVHISSWRSPVSPGSLILESPCW
jgi:hypothetical protein